MISKSDGNKASLTSRVEEQIVVTYIAFRPSNPLEHNEFIFHLHVVESWCRN